MSRKTILPLYAAGDEAAVQGILDELKKKGFRVRNADAPKKGEAVLLFLSAAFAADETLQERFFAADSAGATVVPVDLDGAAQPELVKNVLMAKNAIATQDRTSEEIAARGASAEAFREKRNPKRLGLILLAAALVLAIGAGVWIWRDAAQRRAAEEEERRRLAESRERLVTAAARFGLQPEDLEKIKCVAIIGDCVAFSDSEFFTTEELARHVGKDGAGRWYSAKDDHELKLTHYEDLSILRYLPNLGSLTLILVETDELPPLTEQERLYQVNMSDCVIGDYGGLSGKQPVTVELNDLSVTDLDFLADVTNMSMLSLNRLHALRDISAIGNMTELTWLWIDSCEGVTDWTPIENCRKLTQFGAQNCGGLRSADFLSDKAQLWAVYFSGNCPVESLAFLESLPPSGEYGRNDLTLDCASSPCAIRDWSGLSHIKAFNKLSIDFWCDGDWGDASQALAYLSDAKVKTLYVMNSRNLDLSLLPEVSKRLEIYTSDPTDLSAIPAMDLRELELGSLAYLTSLRGLEKLTNLRTLTVESCRQLETIPDLQSLTMLQQITLSQTAIKDLTPLLELPKLRRVSVSADMTEAIASLDGLEYSFKLEVK